ncbi:hypothetical protein M9Y10_027682 [Tritrichomonas musculus]|uniref:Uncharacterized protein n=1 Tax=Tritrichomonas musculus TaxID=1915356 RepID=A0ABR2H3X0_9EUKA
MEVDLREEPARTCNWIVEERKRRTIRGVGPSTSHRIQSAAAIRRTSLITSTLAATPPTETATHSCASLLLSI